MKETKSRQIAAQGWKSGTVQEFLGLSDAEAAYIELRLKLAHGLKESRQARGMTQVDLARLVESSQSRVAKMESGDPSVSLDLLVRSLLRLGVSRGQLAGMIR